MFCPFQAHGGNNKQEPMKKKKGGKYFNKRVSKKQAYSHLVCSGGKLFVLFCSFIYVDFEKLCLNSFYVKK